VPAHPAPGRLSIVTADGRLVFADQGGRVLAVSPERPDRPEEVAPRGEPVLGTGVAGGRLVVLRADGTMSAFGRD
jgi:hypothetical protein